MRIYRLRCLVAAHLMISLCFATSCTRDPAPSPDAESASAAAGTSPATQADLGPTALAATPDAPVLLAQIGERTITLEDLPIDVRARLVELELEAFGVLRDAVTDLVDREVVALQAAAAGESPGAYLATAVERRVEVPTDEDVAAELSDPAQARAQALALERVLHRARTDRTVTQVADLETRASARLAERVRDRLIRERRAQARVDLVRSWRRAQGVEMHLPVPDLARVELPGSSFVNLDSAHSGAGSVLQMVLDPTDRASRQFEREVRATVAARAEHDLTLSVTYLARGGSAESEKVAEALHCAEMLGGGAAFHRGLFEAPRVPRVADLLAIAVEAGLDPTHFGSCLSRSVKKPAVAAVRSMAVERGVRQAPVLFVDGIRLSADQVRFVPALVDEQRLLRADDAPVTGRS